MDKKKKIFIACIILTIIFTIFIVNMIWSKSKNKKILNNIETALVSAKEDLNFSIEVLDNDNNLDTIYYYKDGVNVSKEQKDGLIIRFDEEQRAVINTNNKTADIIKGNFSNYIPEVDWRSIKGIIN